MERAQTAQTDKRARGFEIERRVWCFILDFACYFVVVELLCCCSVIIEPIRCRCRVRRHVLKEQREWRAQRSVEQRRSTRVQSIRGKLGKRWACKAVKISLVRVWRGEVHGETMWKRAIGRWRSGQCGEKQFCPKVKIARRTSLR